MKLQGPSSPNRILGHEQLDAPQKGVSKTREGAFWKELEGINLKFTRHAEERMERRNIQLDEGDLERLEKAVIAAEDKGASNSLVLMDSMAFIVNVATRNIVTAFDSSRLREGVFTNIDSAVIVRGDDD